MANNKNGLYLDSELYDSYSRFFAAGVGQSRPLRQKLLGERGDDGSGDSTLVAPYKWICQYYGNVCKGVRVGGRHCDRSFGTLACKHDHCFGSNRSERVSASF